MCNLITYLIIDAIKSKNRKLSKIKKRLISAVSAIVIGVAMYHIDSNGNELLHKQLFYGFFIQFLTWDYCFKGLVRTLKKKFEPSDMDTEMVDDDIISDEQ